MARPIINIADLEYRMWGHGGTGPIGAGVPDEKFEARIGAIAARIGAQKLGYNPWQMPSDLRAPVLIAASQGPTPVRWGRILMSEFFSAHLGEILSAIGGAVAGTAISVPITLRISRTTLSGGAVQSNQRGARAGGDVVGRDKISH